MDLRYPKDNSSAWCASDGDCFGNRTCGSSPYTNYNICDCPGYMDPMTRCEKNFFEVLDDHELIYTSLGYISYGFIFLLLLSEILTDLRLRLIRFPLLPKFTLLTFSLIRLTHFTLWTYSSYHGQISNLVTIDTILRTTGVVFLGSITYLNVCIAWSDILLKARNLGQQSRRIPILRKILISVCVIVSCITIPINIYGSVSTKIAAISSVGNAIGGIAIVIALSITTYLLVIVYRWSRTLAEGDFKSKRTKQVLIKTRWLIAMNCNLGLTLVMIGVFSNLPRELPYMALLIESITRIVEISSCICLIGFLESYLSLYRNRPFLGYVYGIIGHSSIMEMVQITKSGKTSDKNSGNGSNKHSSTSSTSSLSNVSEALEALERPSANRDKLARDTSTPFTPTTSSVSSTESSDSTDLTNSIKIITT